MPFSTLIYVFLQFNIVVDIESSSTTMTSQTGFHYFVILENLFAVTDDNKRTRYYGTY